MPDFKSFKTAAEIAAYLAETKAYLDAGVQPWQQEIRAGDHAYWLSVPNYEGNLSDIEVTEANLFTLGAIPIYYEIVAYVRQDGDPPQPPNRRQVMGYSFMVPDGEFGSVHVASIWDVISKEQFEVARESDWPLWIPDRVKQHLAARGQGK